MSDGTYADSIVRSERLGVDTTIRLYGRMIVLHRPNPGTLSDAGGTIRAPGERVLPARRRWYNTAGREVMEQQSGVGFGFRLHHYLMGSHDDDIQPGDWFDSPVDGIRKFIVVDVHEDRTVETRAELEPIT